MKKKVLILDGYNLIYRARYSGMNKGEYSTIFNFFRGLRPLIEKFNPDVSYFVLEGIPVKRLELDPEYKGQREYHNKDSFNEQRKRIISIIEEFYPIKLVKHEEYECDDVIGFIAEQEKIENDVVIISSDSDFIQCIDDNVKLYNPIRKNFIEKPAYDYVLWKSLRGDSCDNIIGFKGIGDKRAEKLCKNPNDLEEFLLKEDNKLKLEKNLKMIKLHNLDNDANNILIHSNFAKGKWEGLKDIFSKFEFSSIIKKQSTWEKYVKTFKNLEKEYHD